MCTRGVNSQADPKRKKVRGPSYHPVTPFSAVVLLFETVSPLLGTTLVTRPADCGRGAPPLVLDQFVPKEVGKTF